MGQAPLCSPKVSDQTISGVKNMDILITKELVTLSQERSRPKAIKGLVAPRTRAEFQLVSDRPPLPNEDFKKVQLREPRPYPPPCPQHNDSL